MQDETLVGAVAVSNLYHVADHEFATGSLETRVRYNEHVSTYHSFYGTADVRKVSFNVLQKDDNMVDKIVSACAGEWDGGKEGNACVGEFSQPPGHCHLFILRNVKFFTVSCYCA